MIRELKMSYSFHLQQKNARVRNDMASLLRNVEQDLGQIEDVSEKTKVKELRLEISLKSVEANLNSYRRNLKKKMKLEKKNKQPKLENYRRYNESLEYVETLLAEIREIKKGIREESRRAIQEEKAIHREAA
tara:strand:+ start:2230 stop:2625 length:396 start_codon:yes stop_codon:yes gene_type:complete